MLDAHLIHRGVLKVKNLLIGKSLLAVAVSLAISSSANADTYFGGSIGQSDINEYNYETADSFKVFGGTRSDNLGFEAAYIDMGQFDISGQNGTGSIDVNGFELSAVGYLPLSDNLDLMAKFGLFAWNVDAMVNNSSYGSDDGIDPTIGVGAQFKITDNMAVRAEYQVVTDVSGGDIDMLSAGLSFNF